MNPTTNRARKKCQLCGEEYVYRIFHRCKGRRYKLTTVEAHAPPPIASGQHIPMQIWPPEITGEDVPIKNESAKDNR
jgi:hypothetical protein